MVAKLLDTEQDDVLYYENMEGGHCGAADNKQRAFMDTLAYTFLWDTLTGAMDEGDGEEGEDEDGDVEE